MAEEKEEKSAKELGEEMRKKYIELQEELKRAQAYEDKVRKRNADLGIEKGDAEEKLYVPNEKGEKVRRFDVVEQEIKRAMDQRELTNTHDARTAILGMAGLCYDTIKLITYSARSSMINHPIFTPLKHQLMDTMEQQFEELKAKMSQSKPATPEVLLPTLHHLVKFKDNKLEIEPLQRDFMRDIVLDASTQKRIDGYKQKVENNMNELDNLFKETVKLWLKEKHNYVEASNERGAPNPGVFVNDGTPLTKEEFKRINTGNNSLKKYIEENAKGLRFEERGEPEPEPEPEAPRPGF